MSVVKLDYERLVASAGELTGLADRLEQQKARAVAMTPISLPSLSGTTLDSKVTWMRDQVEMLGGLADIAMLLDDSGNGMVTMSMGDIQDKVNDLLGDYLGSEFGNIFGNDEDFPLISLAVATGKMARMSRGVAPVFQTGLVGRTLLARMAKGSGRAAEWAKWLRSGPSHRLIPTSLLPPPAWARGGNAGWSPLLKGKVGVYGLGATRVLGVAGGVYSTTTGVMNLVEQGNPVDAFKREGAGYVADVAETAFSASATAFLVAPNPVTGAAAVGTGVVWAGAEVVDHYGDDIANVASDAWGGVSEGAGNTVSTVKGWFS